MTAGRTKRSAAQSGRPARGDDRDTARRSRFGDVLSPAFYARDTELVARELLGAVLETHSASGITSGRIVETEAYLGEHDAACHAAAGRTARTDPLYGAPGIAYVYFIYGVHWCVNAVTRAEGLPSAVLIRALEPLDGIEAMRARRPRARRPEDLTNGPGKLCAALGIAGSHNRLPLQQPPILIRRGEPLAAHDIVEATRIGITKAADLPLRWYARGSAFVSRR